LIVRLTLAYRGAGYAGWQRQANALAIQEVVERALGGLVDAPVTLAGASRTDAGVHARGQVAHFELELPAREIPLRGLVHGTNHHLPQDIRVLAAEEAPAGFHARFSARAKEYRYRLSRAPVLTPFEAPYTARLDTPCALGPLREATAALVGRHDFSAFALAGGAHSDAARTIEEAEWQERGDTLCFRIVGDGFLRGMVRSLVGTLLEVGAGRRTPAAFADLLAGPPAGRGAAGPTAPAHGLILEQVFYARGPAA
jgi:tRNA pseudouridine38-40 synthase